MKKTIFLGVLAASLISLGAPSAAEFPFQAPRFHDSAPTPAGDPAPAWIPTAPGNLNMDGYAITGIGAPTTSSSAVNLATLQSVVSQLQDRIMALEARIEELEK